MGDKELLQKPYLASKLRSKWLSPYEVAEIGMSINFFIKINKKLRLVHINRLRYTNIKTIVNDNRIFGIFLYGLKYKNKIFF